MYLNISLELSNAWIEKTSFLNDKPDIKTFLKSKAIRNKFFGAVAKVRVALAISKLLGSIFGE